MLLLDARPSDRGILAATLAVAAAATLALSSGYVDTGGWLLPEAPAAVIGAQNALAPAPVSRNRPAPAPTASPALADGRGVALYLLMEAGRPAPLFAR